MPDSKLTTEADKEPVTFENWADAGTHVFVGHKYLLTLATPESSKCDEAYRAFIEDWISPDEYCTHLAAILRALGASPAVLAALVQWNIDNGHGRR